MSDITLNGTQWRYIVGLCVDLERAIRIGDFHPAAVDAGRLRECVCELNARKHKADATKFCSCTGDKRWVSDNGSRCQNCGHPISINDDITIEDVINKANDVLNILAPGDKRVQPGTVADKPQPPENRKMGG